KDLLAVEVSAALAPALPPLLARLRDVFDLNARPDVIAEHLQGDPRLGPRVRRLPRLRVPGAFGGFELAVRAGRGPQAPVRAAAGDDAGGPLRGRVRRAGRDALAGAESSQSAAGAGGRGEARAANRARHHRQPRGEHPGAGPRRRRRPAAPARGRGPGTRDPATGGVTRHRRLDGAVRRPAYTALAGRLPGERPGLTQGVGHAFPAPAFGGGGGVAPVAGLRSPVPVEQPEQPG